LKAAPFSDGFQRRWFLAQILFEMMIDRLMVRHMYHVCETYYKGLDEVDQF
jgi:hypothetical protein